LSLVTVIKITKLELEVKNLCSIEFRMSFCFWIRDDLWHAHRSSFVYAFLASWRRLRWTLKYPYKNVDSLMQPKLNARLPFKAQRSLQCSCIATERGTASMFNTSFVQRLIYQVPGCVFHVSFNDTFISKGRLLEPLVFNRPTLSFNVWTVNAHRPLNRLDCNQWFTVPQNTNL
jgi:hypothetical protein